MVRGRRSVGKTLVRPAAGGCAGMDERGRRYRTTACKRAVPLWSEWDASHSHVMASPFGRYTAMLPLLLAPATSAASAAFSRYQCELGAMRFCSRPSVIAKRQEPGRLQPRPSTTAFFQTRRPTHSRAGRTGWCTMMLSSLFTRLARIAGMSAACMTRNVGPTPAKTILVRAWDVSLRAKKEQRPGPAP